MGCYHICSKENASEDSYWVLASSSDEARRLVAQYIDGASDAEDQSRYECLVADGDRKCPPEGFIHRRLFGPVSIKAEN